MFLFFSFEVIKVIGYSIFVLLRNFKEYKLGVGGESGGWLKGGD